MKQLINDLYQCAISDALKQHIINDLGFSTEDKAIIKSLMLDVAMKRLNRRATRKNV